jgi:hypothetical protein
MSEARPIGALRGTIAGVWNLDFTSRRRANIRRDIHQNLRCSPQGKGNKAWKRVAANEHAWRKAGGFYVSDFI